MEYIILAPCVTAKTRELRLRGKIDIIKAGKELPPDAEIIGLTGVFLTLAYKGKSLSIYPSGKIIIKDSEGEEAKSLLREVFALLEKKGCLSEN